ncbi:hypothetical protein AAFH68_39250 [Flavobacterium sp. CGRL1]
MNIGDQFKGLPMEDLIGGPLSAAVKSNTDLAKATAAFINDIGFEKVKDAEGTIVPGPARMVDFVFERPGLDKDGNATVEEVKMKLPMLAIVPIPNLQVDLVDITFDMEVKSSTKSVESSASKGEFSASMSAKIAFFFYQCKRFGFYFIKQRKHTLNRSFCQISCRGKSNQSWFTGRFSKSA